MKSYYAIAVVLVIALAVVGYAAISGFILQAPFDGSPPKVDQSRIDAVTASAMAWLAGSMGSDRFPAGILASPIAVFAENSSAGNYSVDHWVLPVVNSEGMYIGFFSSKGDSFTTPGNDMIYPEPRHNLFSMTKEDAYTQMFYKNPYLSNQIKEPFLSAVGGRGYAWTSNVVVNGQKVGVLNVFVSIIDPSPADNKIKSDS